jgi:hypothetical protein
MIKLSEKLFTAFSGDNETDQYRILAELKEYGSSFRKKLLYPGISELIDLASTLTSMLEQKNTLEKSFPKEIIGFDVEAKKIIVKEVENPDKNMESLFELIEWAIPVIKQSIEEGIALYEFVEKNINIDQVGILPLYKDEGYFIIPDNTKDKLLIHRFHFALFEGEKEKFRTLKTRFIDAVDKVLVNTPEYLKLRMVETYKDMPNPATYFCETDLDLPFQETLFPVAKRKLLSRIS